jgi:hypothetical protein
MKVNLSIMKRLSKYCRTSAVYVVKRSHPWYRAGITGLYVDRIAETKGLDALDRQRAKHAGEFQWTRNGESLTSW